MAGGSNEYRAALVRRQHTLALISSCPGRPDFRRLSFFRQATVSWTIFGDVRPAFAGLFKKEIESCSAS